MPLWPGSGLPPEVCLSGGSASAPDSSLSSDPYFFPTSAASTPKNQAGRYAAGRRRQAAGKRTGQAALIHGILHALCQ